jgi:hypothetical protein
MTKSKEEWAKIYWEISDEREEARERERLLEVQLQLAANEMGKQGLDLVEVVGEGLLKSGE